MVGGGQVALRKVTTLLQYGALVRVISPRLCAGLAKLAAADRIEFMHRDYSNGDLEGACIAVVATGSRSINQKASQEAKGSGILVNVVDDPELSDFIVPAVMRRGSLSVAVSTGGKSPALARRLKVKLGEQFGQEYGRLAEVIEGVRLELKNKRIRPGSQRWQEAIDPDSMAALIREGKEGQARQLLLDRLTYK